MPAIIIYGIPNCDTTKKALALLEKSKADFYFHDYKQSAITPQKLEAWCKSAGWETVLNKRSTTWRELDEQTQKEVTGQAAAIKLMLTNNSLIKRPVIEMNDNLLIGFNETEIIKQLKSNK